MAGRRADVISQAGNDNGFCLNSFCVIGRVEVSQTFCPARSPAVETVFHGVAGQIQAPWDKSAALGYVGVKPGSRQALKSTLASTTNDEDFTVPFRLCLDPFQSAYQTKHHSAEIGSFRSGVFFFAETVSIQFGFPQVLIVFIRLAIGYPVSIDIQLESVGESFVGGVHALAVKRNVGGHGFWRSVFRTAEIA